MALVAGALFVAFLAGAFFATCLTGAFVLGAFFKTSVTVVTAAPTAVLTASTTSSAHRNSEAVQQGLRKGDGELRRHGRV